MARDARKFPYGRTSGFALPPPETKRWVPRRKAEVVAAVEEGILTLDEACKMYALSSEEFLGWKKALERHGLAGLRRAYARAQDAPAKRPRRGESGDYLEAQL
jgi:hypothetical protein